MLTCDGLSVHVMGVTHDRPTTLCRPYEYGPVLVSDQLSHEGSQLLTWLVCLKAAVTAAGYWARSHWENPSPEKPVPHQLRHGSFTRESFAVFKL